MVFQFLLDKLLWGKFPEHQAKMLEGGRTNKRCPAFPYLYSEQTEKPSRQVVGDQDVTITY